MPALSQRMASILADLSDPGIRLGLVVAFQNF
jgi:hypothetical protein